MLQAGTCRSAVRVRLPFGTRCVSSHSRGHSDSQKALISRGATWSGPKPSACAITRWCSVYFAVPEADLSKRSAFSPVPWRRLLRMWFMCSRMAIVAEPSDSVQPSSCDCSSEEAWNRLSPVCAGPLAVSSVDFSASRSDSSARRSPCSLAVSLVDAPPRPATSGDTWREPLASLKCTTACAHSVRLNPAQLTPA